MRSAPISLSPELWRRIFRLGMRAHGRAWITPALLVDKALNVIVKPLIWEDLELHPHQLSHLVTDICHDSASPYPVYIFEWTRKIRFIADAAQPWMSEAAALILLYTRDLKRVYADQTTFGTSFVKLLRVQHSHTLQQLMLRVSVSHDVTTYLLDQFPCLNGLGLIFEAGVPYQAVSDNLRPLGLSPGSFSRLICFHIELSYDLGLYGDQHTSVLRMLSHSRLPALCTINFVMRNIPSASEAVNALRLVIANHSKTLDTVHFDLPPLVLKAILPKLTLDAVYIRQYDGRIPLGAYTSLHIRHLSVGPYDNLEQFSDQFTFKHSLALQDMLLSIYSRIQAAAAAGRVLRLQTIQLYELSWSEFNHRQFAATQIGPVAAFARAFHDLGIRVLDRHKCELDWADPSCTQSQ